MHVELQSEDESLLFSAFDVEHDRLFFSSSSGVIRSLHLNPSQVRVCFYFLFFLYLLLALCVFFYFLGSYGTFMLLISTKAVNLHAFYLCGLYLTNRVEIESVNFQKILTWWKP